MRHDSRHRCDCGTRLDANGYPTCRAIDQHNATVRAKVAARKARHWTEGVNERLIGLASGDVRAAAARVVPGEARRQGEQSARVRRGR